MSQDGTLSANMLPMVIDGRQEKPSLARLPANADFISQLIAARDRLASQRARRRAPVQTALDAYDKVRGRGTPRLPSGSYRSRTV